VTDESRYRSAIDALDAVHRLSPPLAAAGDSAGDSAGDEPSELRHARRMTVWLARLDPGATEAQRLAARAAHLRRWALPRTDYPEGRAGYLRWRTEQKRRHADEVVEILRSVGYDEPTCDEVARLVRKEGRDAAAQTHEDALCLVFLETQLEQVVGEWGEERTVAIVRKTLPKMSERARAAANDLPLGAQARAVLGAALASDS
jgi:hypothetical protein